MRWPIINLPESRAIITTWDRCWPELVTNGRPCRDVRAGKASERRRYNDSGKSCCRFSAECSGTQNPLTSRLHRLAASDLRPSHGGLTPAGKRRCCWRRQRGARHERSRLSRAVPAGRGRYALSQAHRRPCRARRLRRPADRQGRARGADPARAPRPSSIRRICCDPAIWRSCARSSTTPRPRPTTGSSPSTC